MPVTDLDRQRRRLQSMLADPASSARMLKRAQAALRALTATDPAVYAAVKAGAARSEDRNRPASRGREGRSSVRSEGGRP